MTFDQDAQFVDVAPQSPKHKIGFLAVKDPCDRMPDGLTMRLDGLSEGA
jgi:hypothetical protein